MRYEFALAFSFLMSASRLVLGSSTNCSTRIPYYNGPCYYFDQKNDYFFTDVDHCNSLNPNFTLPKFASVNDLNLMAQNINANDGITFWLYGFSYYSLSGAGRGYWLQQRSEYSSNMQQQCKTPAPTPTTRCFAFYRNPVNFSTAWVKPPQNNPDSSLSCMQLLPVLCQTSTSAPNRFSYDNRNYFVLSENYTFFEAIVQCRAAGGQLAEVYSGCPEVTVNGTVMLMTQGYSSYPYFWMAIFNRYRVTDELSVSTAYPFYYSDGTQISSDIIQQSGLASTDLQNGPCAFARIQLITVNNTVGQPWFDKNVCTHSLTSLCLREDFNDSTCQVSGGIVVNGNCYLFSATAFTLYGSIIDCLSQGGSLAKFTTVAELSQLIQAGKSANKFNQFWLSGFTLTNTNSNPPQLVDADKSSANTANYYNLDPTGSNKRCLALLLNTTCNTIPVLPGQVCQLATNFIVNSRLIAPPVNTLSKFSCAQKLPVICQILNKQTCPDSGWVRNTNNCFRIVWNYTSWFGALKTCNDFTEAQLLRGQYINEAAGLLFSDRIVGENYFWTAVLRTGPASEAPSTTNTFHFWDGTPLSPELYTYLSQSFKTPPDYRETACVGIESTSSIYGAKVNMDSNGECATSQYGICRKWS